MKKYSPLKSATLWLLLCALIHSCNSGIARRRLHRAKADKVPDRYYVHFKRETTTVESEELITTIEQFSQDPLMPGFNVVIQGVLTKTGHGFAAQLSNESLKFVS